MRIKDDKKIESIKIAAIELIQELGFHGTSVSKIAKKAGVSPATIYIYYENKEEMLKELYIELKERMISFILRDTDNLMQAKKTFYLISKAYYEFILSNKDEYYFIKQFKSCPALHDQCDQNLSSYKKINEIINNYKEQGIIKDVDNSLIFAFLLFSVEGISEYNLSGKCCISENSFDQVYDMIWDGISIK
jgi:AcrR family transcriptional regulator